MSEELLNEIKIAIREKQCPYFSDEEISYYFNQCDGDLRATIYRCLIVKSEDTTVSVSGLTAPDTSVYFKRLASHYRKSNSGTLKDW